MPVTKEEYLEAVATLDEWVNDPDSNWSELKLPAETQLHGILKALRHILKCGEGESILYRAATIMRRYEMSWPEFRMKHQPPEIAPGLGSMPSKESLSESPPHSDFPDFPGPQHA